MNWSTTGTWRWVTPGPCWPCRQLSVRETEALVKRLQKPAQPRSRAVDPDILRLQDDLTEKLCARVRIQHNARGKGKLVIAYNSADELEGIIGHLTGG